jgi:ABC-type branched-subunit amino acid transport system substrate-binding protein
MKRRLLLQHGLGSGLALGVLPTLTGLPGVARAADKVKLAMMIPMSGPAALFGPSSRNCSELAAGEINRRGGLAGRQIELVFGDAGVPPAEASQAALKLWRGEHCEAFIGMHDSAVRAALVGLFKGQVPYIYTPTNEGGECAKGVYILGETPQQQLEPVIPWLGKERSLKRWYLIGNDYNWPRGTNAAAKDYIKASGASIVGEEYLPFTVDNFDANLAKIRESQADAVLITLVGGASVGFSRAFASFGLGDKAIRLGTLIDENTLAGIGAQSSQNLYSSAGYFGSIQTPAAQAFAADYKKAFGDKGLPLNALGESCYEGLLLLEAMANKAKGLKVDQIEAVANGISYDGPRGHTVLEQRYCRRDIYLAQAEGAQFKVVKTFPKVAPGQNCKL